MAPSPQPSTFIPTLPQEVALSGWDRLDVILVSGDTYIDSPYIGTAVIARVLAGAGYRVGIIAQPDVHSAQDITRLGEPALFWGVTGGSVDSMIANTTASGKRRKSDDLTPGGQNTRRPDRAVIVYSNLIRRFFKNTAPIVLGGIEASLRRISHYDAWSDAVRRAILFDAKADLLIYGMAEQSVLELAQRLALGEEFRSVRGLCYISPQAPPPADEFDGPDIELADHGSVSRDKAEFTRMFKTFYANSDPLTAKRLYQRQDTRYLVHNPPPAPLSSADLDRIYELPFTRDVHPYYAKDGRVAALDTIRFSLTTHRGCYGECRFCAISVHQGRQIVSRSEASILREAVAFANHPEFKGIISDVGGPTANMYGIECSRKLRQGACTTKACLFPKVCKQLACDHRRQITLLKKLRHLPGVRKVFVGSGVRYDLILADKKSGAAYLEALLINHVSGQLKIAPEHVQEAVLNLMGKPGRKSLEAFMDLFERLKQKHKKKIFLTYYLMAAHPGCTLSDMHALRAYVVDKLHLLPEQVQIFTPSPSTYATLMYYTGIDPFTGETIFVERDPRRKARQKAVITDKRRPPKDSS